MILTDGTSRIVYDLTIDPVFCRQIDASVFELTEEQAAVTPLVLI